MTKSPCIKVCRIEHDICVGCGRTLDEIRLWTQMNDTERTAVVVEAAARLERGKNIND